MTQPWCRSTCLLCPETSQFRNLCAPGKITVYVFTTMVFRTLTKSDSRSSQSSPCGARNRSRHRRKLTIPSRSIPLGTRLPPKLNEVLIAPSFEYWCRAAHPRAAIAARMSCQRLQRAKGLFTSEVARSFPRSDLTPRSLDQ